MPKQTPQIYREKLANVFLTDFEILVKSAEINPHLVENPNDQILYSKYTACCRMIIDMRRSHIFH
jgi:hypothetical protein